MSPVPWSSTSYISASFHVFLNSSALSSFPYRLLCRSPRADCGTEFKSLFYCFPRRISLVVLACNMWCTASAPKTTHVKIWLPSSQNDPLRREKREKKKFLSNSTKDNEQKRRRIETRGTRSTRFLSQYERKLDSPLKRQCQGRRIVQGFTQVLQALRRTCTGFAKEKRKEKTAAAISLCRSRSSNLYGFRYEMTLARLDARAALRTTCRQKRQTLYAKECWSVCTARMHFAAS